MEEHPPPLGQSCTELPPPPKVTKRRARPRGPAGGAARWTHLLFRKDSVLPSRMALASVLGEGQVINVFDFVGHVVSAAAAQLLS